MAAYRTAPQVSSGGVIVRDHRGELQVCLIARRRNRQEFWRLPKGHLEPGEHPQDTAVREVLEETGLHGDPLASLGSIVYRFTAKEARTRYVKTVHFYLLRYRDGEARAQDTEVDDLAWLSLEDALARISYDNERRILLKAQQHLKKVTGEGSRV